MSAMLLEMWRQIANAAVFVWHWRRSAMPQVDFWGGTALKEKTSPMLLEMQSHTISSAGFFLKWHIKGQQSCRLIVLLEGCSIQ